MGYSLIDDIIGQRNVVIRVEQVRDIFLLGQQQSRYLFLALTGGGTLIGIVTVSYTHLDVYKRQVCNRHHSSHPQPAHH